MAKLKTTDAEAGDGPQLKSRDELYEGAVDVVVREGRGSVSLLQRTLGIGYGRAARLIESGRIACEQIVTATFGLEKLAECVAGFNEHRDSQVKVAIDPWQ